MTRLDYDSVGAVVAAVAVATEPITVTSAWLRVESDRVQQFADATNDHQWIHLDDERAASGPFGATIVHGHLLLSLLPALSSSMIHIDGVSMGINYGANRVRFITPVLVGSRVRARTELGSAELTSTGLRLITHVTIDVEGEPKPAMVAEAVSLFVPSETA